MEGYGNVKNVVMKQMKSKKAIKKRIAILKEELKPNHAWITKATTIALINELEWVLADKKNGNVI